MNPKYTILVTETNGFESRWGEFGFEDDARDEAQAMHLGNRYVQEVEIIELEEGDKFID